MSNTQAHNVLAQLATRNSETHKRTLAGIQPEMSYGCLLTAPAPFHTAPDVDAARFMWDKNSNMRTVAYFVGAFAGVVTTVCAIAMAVLS